ncbi:TPM domain-containing protein [Paeniglutamicibacter sp. MACA_103]|uniref:TPM domain-containing protein n=1 Tax=Paeniglutamicibacter sp. MACA_103 TaxID=3377337 RepID=UPI00389642A5
MKSLPRRMALVASAGILSLFMLAPPASADSPVQIPPGEFVVDQARVLGSDATEVTDAVNQLRLDTGQSLFVIYVDTFSNPDDPDDWVREVAENKQMGSSDSVLAIAVGQRQARLVSHDDGDIVDQDQEIFTKLVSPQLSRDDWAAAALGAVTGIENVAAGNSPTGQEATNGTGESGGSGGGAGWILVGGVAIVGGATAWALARRKKLPAGPPQVATGPDGKPLEPLASLSIPDLRTKAGSLLIAADDAIRSSEQEVGFAQAQFGEAAVKPFAEDIEAAKAHMSESFKLQQQLDDHIPDTEADQRSWLGEIIRRCEAVNETLEAHTEEFASLRELEQNAPAAAASLKAQIEPMRQRVGTVRDQLTGLTARYTDGALHQVHTNIAEATDRLDFANTAVLTAEAKISASESAEAAVAVRAGEDAVHQATVLLDAVAHAGDDLDKARADLESLVSTAAKDLAQGRALVANGSNPELAGSVAVLEAALSSVQTQVGSGRVDPVALVSEVDAGLRPLNDQLNRIRDAQERANRAAESLQAAIRTAQMKISGTDDFIRARRGGVGATARTRLAEAQRNLEEALRLAPSDPLNALSHAEHASALADQAAREAESDVDGFGGGYGGGFGGGRGGGSGLGGAILGGILIDSILRGGSHSGDSGGGLFGGGGFGGFGGGGGGGGFGGGFGDGAGGSF